MIGGANEEVNPVNAPLPIIPETESTAKVVADVAAIIGVVPQLAATGKIALTKPNITEDKAKKLLKKPHGEALINIDRLKNVGGVQRVEITNKSSYKKFMKWVYRGFKVTLGTVGTVVSFGAGGDTIPDTFFLVIDTVFLVANISSILILTVEEEIAHKYIHEIYYIKWEGDPYKVQMVMNNIFKEIDKVPTAMNIYRFVCQKYLAVLDSFAAAFGSLISTLIPDDAGSSRIVVELIISEGARYLGRGPFEALVWIFNSIPSNLQKVLKNEQNLKEFIMTLISFFRNVLPTKDDTFWGKVKKNVKRFAGVQGAILVGLVVPGIGPLLFPIIPAIQTANLLASTGLTGEMVIEFIDGKIVPHVDAYAKFMMTVIPLVYAVTLVFDHCKDIV